MTEILKFDDALEKSSNSTRNLLLGNGFSIACDSNIFDYKSLYENSANMIRQKMPEVYKIFESLGIKDFEKVIYMLIHTNKVLPFYLPDDIETVKRMLGHIDQLKEILINVIANSHPEFPNSIPEEKFVSCRKFLSYFISDEENPNGRVYTFNYDLLLYWTLMHEEKIDDKVKINLHRNDGFGKEELIDNYVIWKNDDHSRDQRVFYLHGGVHLFDTGSEVEKYTWLNKGRPLIEQAREAIINNKFPLFVAEGESLHKLDRIKHQPYLKHGYGSFLQVVRERKSKGKQKKSLFIYGHSLAKNDDHIINEIGKGSCSSLFVSIYGDPSSQNNLGIINKARKLQMMRNDKHPLEVSFYDAESARIWG